MLGTDRSFVHFSNFSLLFSKGGDLPSIEETGQLPMLLLQWVKTNQALLMLFSNGTLQVCDASSPLGKSIYDLPPLLLKRVLDRLLMPNTSKAPSC